MSSGDPRFVEHTGRDLTAPEMLGLTALEMLGLAAVVTWSAVTVRRPR